MYAGEGLYHYVLRSRSKIRYDLKYYTTSNITDIFVQTDEAYKSVLGWNCNIEIQTSRLFWNQFRENKWLVPKDDPYSRITEPDVSDGVHKSAGHHDAGLSASVSANKRIRICTFHSVINLQESFFSVQILGECLGLRATYTSPYVTTFVPECEYIYILFVFLKQLWAKFRLKYRLAACLEIKFMSIRSSSQITWNCDM